MRRGGTVRVSSLECWIIRRSITLLVLAGLHTGSNVSFERMEQAVPALAFCLLA
jgi:hypothetical protein